MFVGGKVIGTWVGLSYLCETVCMIYGDAENGWGWEFGVT